MGPAVLVLATGTVLAVASLVFATLSMRQLVEDTRREERAVAVLAQAGMATTRIASAQVFQRSYLANADPEIAAAYARERVEATQEIEELRALALDAGQIARIDELQASARELFALLDSSMELRRTLAAPELLQPGLERRIADASLRTRQLGAEILARQQRILDGRRELARAANLLSTGLLALSAVAVALLMAAAAALMLRFQRERNRAQERLAAAEQRLGLALEGSGLAVWDWDLRADRIYLSETWSRIVGGPPGEVRSSAVELLAVAHPDDRAAISAAVAGLQEPGSDSYRMEHRVMAADGEYRWILSRGKVVERNAAGRAVRMTGTNADITERKRVELLREEFVSTVSHELRTPLTSISASLSLLAGGAAGALPGDAAQLVGIANTNCDRLVRLVNGILDFQRARGGGLQVEAVACDAAELARRACASLDGLAGAHGVALRVQVEGGTVVAHADPDRTIQVLTNLVSNAVTFSTPGSDVDVVVRPAGARVRVEVRDRGPGVPMGFRPRLFQEFSQAERADGRMRQGTGLGLAIARRIVERMDGDIGYLPREGSGSIFWFELPAEPAEPSATREQS